MKITGVLLNISGENTLLFYNERKEEDRILAVFRGLDPDLCRLTPDPQPCKFHRWSMKNQSNIEEENRIKKKGITFFQTFSIWYL